VLLQAGQQTEVLRTTLDLQASMVYDVVAIGRTADQSLEMLVLTAPTMPRQGAVATPAASPMVPSGATPVIGTPIPVGTPASPVAPPTGATPVVATSVPATPEASPDTDND
jgi:hypothetical protein